jgi:hypothetical protein
MTFHACGAKLIVEHMAATAPRMVAICMTR